MENEGFMVPQHDGTERRKYASLLYVIGDNLARAVLLNHKHPTGSDLNTMMRAM